MRSALSRRALLIGGGAALAGCRRRAAPRPVVVYVSLDEPYARPVLDAFERETGLRAVPVYDTEAAKSRGLARRIREERARPRADVFWSSEILQMLALRRDGALEPYRPAAAEGIPPRYRDPEGYWTGFAGRFRVLVYHRGKVAKPPRSLLELTDPRWRGAVAMADPRFGTTMTEAAALFQVLGEERARDYYRRRAANDTRIVDGNSVAAEQVAAGEVLVGQTDTDDAYTRMDAGRPLGLVFPDQGGIGALLIPNTAARVRGGPNPEGGRRFLDFLLRPETELLLAGLPARQLPLRDEVAAKAPERVRALVRVRRMDVSYSRLVDHYEEIDAFLRETFQR